MKTQLKKCITLCFFIMIISHGYPAMAQDRNPHVAIVISKTSYTHHWGVTQMAAHGWGGVVNLAGIPYSCLFIEDMTSSEKLRDYDCLIFGQCSYLSNPVYKTLTRVIKEYLDQGGNIIFDGIIGAFDEKTRERDHTALDNLLQSRSLGFQGNENYRIRVCDITHFVSKSYEKDQYVTQHLVNGLTVQDFTTDGRVLLELTDERQTYPFLSCLETENNRLVIVNDFSTWAGVPSFFRNQHPQVFYPNQICNVLIQAVYWAVYGDLQLPVPSLQVANAPMTAIIRLDADASQNLDAQIQTISYLIEIANETGVVPLYAWVSSQATKAGWQDLAPLGKKLEDAGGQIGTHSRFHHIDQEMTEKRWKEELDDAIREIEFNMSDYGYDIGKVDCFINPGNTIRMADYAQLARRFGFYMTHGFEQDMPIGFGNFTWFNEAYPDFVVLEDSPSPDYQWFYDPTWSYTTQQITAYEENIFDHIYHTIQRGVIFNQMWHDYSITSQPQYGKERIVNKNNRAMYDGIKSRFKSSEIYCPDPYDLKLKLMIMARCRYTWKVEGNEVIVELNFDGLDIDSSLINTGGMGLHINNTPFNIQQVFLNGQPHPAFSDQTIILPDLGKEGARINAILGEARPDIPRLLYTSKKMPAIRMTGDTLSVQFLTKNKARFSFYMPRGYVLLNADGQEWNRQFDNILRGYVTSDCTVNLQPLPNHELTVARTDMRIKSVHDGEQQCVFTLQPVNGITRCYFDFISTDEIQGIELNQESLPLQKTGSHYRLVLDNVSDINQLLIHF